MDFLLDPNVAYLFLVAGVLFGIMAVVTPGTGLFEVAAIFCLALAGYAVYNLNVNWWALLLLGVGIVPFVYATQGRKREPYLGLSILLLVVGSVFLFAQEGGRPAVNPFVAILASSLLAGYIWLIVRKAIQAALERPRHDLAGLVGQIGEAKTRVGEEGSVQVAGELWSARSEETIPAGSSVRVISRDGFVLIVEKAR